ncbi:MAG: hypothetical protein E7631_12340, partial [Ruminococcaceae bacterium]|nr:hypothetical protein [Oscillospiraceae bacterium]
TDRESLFVVPTRNDKGEYAVLLSYSSEHFEEDLLPDAEEKLIFDEDITGKTVTVWCIDRETTNPYRLYQKMGMDTPTEEELKLLREEGRLKPVRQYTAGAGESLQLTFTPNALYLVAVTD